MANVNTQCFIEATIYEPKKHRIFAYSPLVITAGTNVLVKPVVPKISKKAIIVYHFGSNANTITLEDQTNGTTLKNAKCVNGLTGSVFGQFAYCNAAKFFPAARKGLKKSKQIPPLGRARDGSICPTSRSFEIVDQDQSDNVVTKYLLINNVSTVQNTAHNRKKFNKNAVLINPSDELLLSEFVDPAIGCKPFKIPALDDPHTSRATLAGNELSATFKQHKPIALVPLTDPMTLVNGAQSLQKTNLYRVGAGQPQAATPNGANGTTYCILLGKIAPPVILRQGRFTSKFRSLVPAVGNTLFTFLGARFQASWGILNCANLTGLASPIVANVNGDGVATNLTFTINGKTIGPTATGILHHHHHRHHHHHHK